MKRRVSCWRWGILPALVLVLVLAACGGGDEEQLPDQPVASEDAILPAPGEQARLRCSDACASHGHCGQTLNQGVHVLLNRGRPVAAAGQQDMAVPAETLVTVSEVQPRTVQFVSGEQQQRNFFRVFVPDRNEEAWVVDWCLVGAQ